MVAGMIKYIMIMDDVNINNNLFKARDAEPKTEVKPDVISRSKLLTTDIQYFPRNMPESKLAYAADRCLQVIFDHSEEAKATFFKIVASCSLPGCAQFMSNFIKQHPKQISRFSSSIFKYPINKFPAKPVPNIFNFIDIDSANFTNPDMCDLISYVNGLILKQFNRKIDLDNDRPKIVPDLEKVEPRALLLVIFLRALISSLSLDIDKIDRQYRGENKRIMEAKNLTTRRERQRKSELLNRARGYGLVMIHDTKLYKDALMWYKCRVNPGTIEAYRDELAQDNKYSDRSNIETTIAICDEATGYPRQWRK
jgi:hypothetical protein